MKKENAIARVEKFGKKGSKSFELVMNALNNGCNTIRPVSISGKGRFATNLDYTMQVKLLLNACKIKYVAGNDAPRGGLTGNYVTLTHIEK